MITVGRPFAKMDGKDQLLFAKTGSILAQNQSAIMDVKMECVKVRIIVHAKLDGEEKTVLSVFLLLGVNMDHVLDHMNATVIRDGLDLIVKDVSSKTAS